MYICVKVADDFCNCRPVLHELVFKVFLLLGRVALVRGVAGYSDQTFP